MSVSVVAGKPSVGIGDPGILWSPIASPMRLQFSGTSCESVAEALQMGFGDFPIRLSTGEHMFILRGMMASAGPGKQPYDQLIKALTQFGTLEITKV